MSHSISTLCATVTATSSAALGLSFAQQDPTTSFVPSSDSNPNYSSIPQPTIPRSMIEPQDASPARSSPRFLSRRISSFQGSLSSAITSDSSHASRPGPFRRTTSASTPSNNSGKESGSRSNAHSSSSAQPFISPGLVTPPSAPNKLVKRTPSQRDPHSAPPSSFKFQLKKPATSHQRSATWSMQNFEASRNQELRPVAAYTDPTPTSKSKHLLQVRSVKKRTSHEHDTLYIRQIRPTGATPILLPAGDVSAPEVFYVEEVPDPEPRKAPRISSSPVPSSPRAESLESQTPTKRFLQRHESGSRKRTTNTSPQANLMRRISRRITSAPALHLRNMEQTDKHSGQESHQQQRPPPSGSFSFESENEASPPSTPSSIPFRLLQRRTRPSATSSERTSSRPGSEGGPRVFSWTEGFDDDTNSDTVYDSIRTATTRSTSGQPRVGLDTLFDNSNSSLTKASGNRTVSAPVTFADADSQVEHPTPVAKRPRTPIRRKPSVRIQDYDSEEDGAQTDHHHESSEPRSDKPKITTRESNGQGLSPRDTGVKSSLFDWSEQPAVAGGSEGGTPPRPKTANPKKQLDPRGGALSAGRRAPSGLHSRSHSVPALQDLAVRQSDVSNKFGSWGIGSKGATESWDNDFEFESFNLDADDVDAGGEIAAEGVSNALGGSMHVPDNIQKQQSNVLANISLLREWGLLIEELKDLRARATTLGARNDETAKLFDEVDAMVDLADQEADNDGMPGLRSPASSQTFSEDDFDQVTPPRPDTAQRTRMSPSDMLRVMQQRNKPARASPRVDSPEAFQRPRQDSEAMARSVIEALQRWRKPVDGETPATPQSRPKKVPFDTATLKHIVPHVNNLMRKVKQLLRELEGLHMSPQVDEEDVGLRYAFRPQQRGEESPGAQKEQRLRLGRGLNRGKSGWFDEDEFEREVKGLNME